MVSDQRAEVIEVEMWRRCVCDQYGRCLTDCPSFDLVRPWPTAYWDRRNRRWVEGG